MMNSTEAKIRCLADPAYQHFNTFTGAFARRGIDVNGNGLLDFDEPAGETLLFPTCIQCGPPPPDPFDVYFEGRLMHRDCCPRLA